MAEYEFHVSLDLNWTVEVEADNEDAAYEALWEIIGYEGDDLITTRFDLEPENEWFDVAILGVSEDVDRG